MFLVAVPPDQAGRGPAATLAQQQLYGSLWRAIKALQKSFGDRLASLTFESMAAPTPAPPADPFEVVLSRATAWAMASAMVSKEQVLATPRPAA